MKIPWRRKWQPTSVFLHEESHGQRRLGGYTVHGVAKNRTRVKRLSMHGCIVFSSVQFSCSVVLDSLRPHKLQHTRPPCPPSTPGVHWDSCPLSQWCHPAISSSVISFSSCPQSLPASESFQMSQLFTWGGQSTGVSGLASFLPKNTQGTTHIQIFPYNSNWRKLFHVLNENKPLKD